MGDLGKIIVATGFEKCIKSPNLITLELTSCLTGLDLTRKVNLLLIKLKLLAESKQAGGQWYSDTSPYKVNKYCLIRAMIVERGL